MTCGVDVRAPRPRGGEPQRVVDDAARDLVIAREAGKNRQAGRVRRRPPGRPHRVRAQVPDRARACRPAAALRLQRIQLVEPACVLVDQQCVTVAGRGAPALDVHRLRDRVLPFVGLVGVLERET